MYYTSILYNAVKCVITDYKKSLKIYKMHNLYQWLFNLISEFETQQSIFCQSNYIRKCIKIIPSCRTAITICEILPPGRSYGRCGVVNLPYTSSVCMTIYTNRTGHYCHCSFSITHYIILCVFTSRKLIASIYFPNTAGESCFTWLT